MRFLCYSDALRIQIKRFEIQRQTKKVSIFSTLCKFHIKTYFLISAYEIIIIYDATIDLKSTVMKKGVFLSM